MGERVHWFQRDEQTRANHKRGEGLNTKLSEAEPENKGLKLMMKMGFKVGSGLGKDGEGRKEPVPINEVKTDKKGIGKAMKEKSDKQIIKNNIMKRQKSNYIFNKNFF